MPERSPLSRQSESLTEPTEVMVDHLAWGLAAVDGLADENGWADSAWDDRDAYLERARVILQRGLKPCVHDWRVQSMKRNGSWNNAPSYAPWKVGRLPSVRAKCAKCGGTTTEPIASEPDRG